EEDGAQTLSRFYYFLAEFKRRLMLCYCVATDAGPLATLVPASFNFEFSPETPPPGATAALSRFAFCRRREGNLVVESPRGHARVILGGREGAQLVAALAQPQTREDLHAALPALSPQCIGMALTLLANAGALTLPDVEGADEDADNTLRQWDFHDLL